MGCAARRRFAGGDAKNATNWGAGVEVEFSSGNWCWGKSDRRAWGSANVGGDGEGGKCVLLFDGEGKDVVDGKRRGFEEKMGLDNI